MKIGSDNGELTFLDIVTIVSFMVALENLDENIDQNQLAEQLNRVLAEVHSHLEEQDRKIDKILEVLNNDL